MPRFTLAIAISAITLLSAGALWFATANGKQGNENELQSFAATAASIPPPAPLPPPSVKPPAVIPTPAPPPPPSVKPPAPIPPRASAEPLATATPATSRYTDPNYGFSFAYPDNFNVGSFDEGDASGTTWHVVLVQSSDAKTGFQVSVAPVDEPGPLTPERLRELGATLLDEPKDTTVGQNIAALSFLSADSGLGRTREVWFIHDQALYQISTYDHLESWFALLLSSWRFEP